VTQLRPTPALLIMIIIDLILQLLSLYFSSGSNPTLLALAGDSLEYWNMSGAIAQGNLFQEEPFLSAPLYPYFLGALRSMGFGLIGIIAIQIILRSATAWLIARISKRIFNNSWLAFCSAALFITLIEPAYFSMRIVNSSLQLFILSFLIYNYLEYRKKIRAGSSLRYGSSFGFAVLTHPPLLAGIPFFIASLKWRKNTSFAVIAMTSALGLCSFATLHNYVATSKYPSGPEFIPISAQAGVTFAHGNAPNTNGTYLPLPGVSANRLHQNQDAYQIAKEKTGKEGWAHTSNYFFKQGLTYLSENPKEFLRLIFLKARWALAGKNYGDLFFISEEFADKEIPKPTPAHARFLQTGWFLPFTIIGLCLMYRRNISGKLPLTIIFLSAVLVVLFFWYSPRYRLPAIPVIAVIIPWVYHTLCNNKIRLLAAISLPIILIESSSAIGGFDRRNELMHGTYKLHTGLNYLEIKEYEKAIKYLNDALQNGQKKSVTHIAIAQSYVDLGKKNGQIEKFEIANKNYEDAIYHYYQAIELNPKREDARQSLVNVLRFLNRNQEAKNVVNEGKRVKSQ
jgi:tetratricopeptide (TPR) repeat protein